jgi:hypothetical protein
MQRHATTLENLSLCLSKQGRGAEGEGPLKEGLDLRTRGLGPVHPATLHCASLFACYYDGRQMHKEAERLRQRVAPHQANALRTPMQSLKARTARALNRLSKLPRIWRTMKRYDRTGPQVRALVAHADINNSDALDRLLAPLPNPDEFRTILAAGKQGLYFVSQKDESEDQVIARYIWVFAKEVVVFSLITVSRDQAQRVLGECAKLRMVDHSTFDAAVRAAIGIEL